MSNTATKELVLSALLQNHSVLEASRQSGISTPTIYKLLKDEEFQGLLKQAKNEILQQTTTNLKVKANRAVQILGEVSEDADTNPQVRVSACRSLLEYSLKYAETADILRRLEKLEENIQE